MESCASSAKSSFAEWLTRSFAVSARSASQLNFRSPCRPREEICNWTDQAENKNWSAWVVPAGWWRQIPSIFRFFACRWILFVCCLGWAALNYRTPCLRCWSTGSFFCPTSAWKGLWNCYCFELVRFVTDTAGRSPSCFDLLVIFCWSNSFGNHWKARNFGFLACCSSESSGRSSGRTADP